MKRIIIVFLAAVLLVGLVLSMANGTENLVNNINRPSNESNEDGEEIAADESLYTIDFNEAIQWTQVSDVYRSDIGMVTLKAGTFSTDSGVLRFTVTPDTYEAITAAGKTSLDPYAVLGDSVNLGEHLCIVYDLDISVDEGYPFEFGVRPDYRTADGKVATADNSLIRYKNGGYFIAGTTEHFVTDIPNSYHYTYVLWNDGSFDAYVDGKLIFECAAAYTEDATYLSGLRFQFNYSADVENDISVSFDNIKVKTFDIGYDGAINYLYANPDVDLSTNEDTVLGGGY